MVDRQYELSLEEESANDLAFDKWLYEKVDQENERRLRLRELCMENRRIGKLTTYKEMMLALYPPIESFLKNDPVVKKRRSRKVSRSKRS